METFKNLILGLLGSKKFIATVAGLIITFAAKYGLNLDPITVQEILAVLIAYIIGQGIADRGKSAAIIQAQVVQGEKVSPPSPEV